MFLSKFAKLAAMSALSFSMFLSPATAQTAIEKAFVAKSKLSNAIWKKHDPNSNVVVDHSAWNAFLGKYVSTDSKGINRVAYARVSSGDKAALKTYLASLQSTDVTKLNRNEQYAFWINLYNASMLNLNLKHYPIKSVFDIKSSILDVKGPFNDNVAKVNGQTLTLDIIESGIVRPLWSDPRLHYAFNCAALGCPSLGKAAYEGASINQQLDRAAINFINHPRAISVSGNKVTASKIFAWYSEDFGNNDKSILRHVSQYAGADLKAKLSGKTKISNYTYDWALNDSGANGS